MIARRTIYTLILAVLLALVLRAWLLDHQTYCDRYVAGDHSQPASIWVWSGTRHVEVPCGDWIDRQPLPFQLATLAEFAVLVVFLLSGIVDAVRWRRSRRRNPF